MGELVLQFLGTGDAFGSGGRFQTCIYVEAPATRFLIDCGASATIAMKRFGVDPQSIDTILLTHLHGDHFGGIPFLERETHVAGTRTRPLTIVGPQGTEQRVLEAIEVLFPGATRTPRSFPLHFIEYSTGKSLAHGQMCITPYPAVHAPATHPHALRVECAGKVIACSGDSEWTEALVDVARDTDLFICEAFTIAPRRSHLDYTTLLAHRSELRAKRILLTHLGEEMLSRAGQLEFECAYDGLRLTL